MEVVERSARIAMTVLGQAPPVAEPVPDARWLSISGARVVPEEGAAHFNRDQCERLSAAFQAEGVRRLLAVSESIDCPTIELGVSPDDLGSVNDRLMLLECALLPDEDSPRCAVVSRTLDDYLLVCGRHSFLTSYFGDVEKARRDFVEFADAHETALGNRVNLEPARRLLESK